VHLFPALQRIAGSAALSLSSRRSLSFRLSLSARLSLSSLLFFSSLLSLPILLTALASCAPSKGTIGAVIAQDDDTGRLFLRDVPPSLAAGQAKLKAGDEILLIDGLDVRRMDAQQVNAALSGEVDSPVKLTLIRQEQILRVTLRRTEAHRLVKKPGKSPESAP
jgi:predicted metalloprotease with PDZ domain